MSSHAWVVVFSGQGEAFKEEIPCVLPAFLLECTGTGMISWREISLRVEFSIWHSHQVLIPATGISCQGPAASKLAAIARLLSLVAVPPHKGVPPAVICERPPGAPFCWVGVPGVGLFSPLLPLPSITKGAGTKSKQVRGGQ